MHRDANERYKSVEALLRDLDHYLKNEPLEARPDSVRYRMEKFIKWNRRPVLATSLTFALVVGLVVFFTVRLAKARDAAVAEAARTQRIQGFMMRLFAADDQDAGPADDLKVVTLVDRGAEQANRLGNEPDIQAELYRNLASVYDNLGKPDRADSLLQSALRVHRSMPQPDQAQVAQDLLALGLLRSEEGRPKEAEPMVREGLATLERQRPLDKGALADATSALGKVLIDSGDYRQAASVLERALRIQEVRDPSSLEMGDTLGLMSIVEMSLGDYAASESLSRRSMAIDQKIYGDNHPNIAADLMNLSQIENHLGEYTEAEKNERRGLAITESWRGLDHPDTARQMSILAATLASDGHYDEAADMLRKAVPILERAYGNASPYLAFTLNALGTAESQQGKAAPAKDAHRRAIAICRAALGGDNYKVGIATSNLGSDDLENREYREAEPLLRDALMILSKSLPSEDANIGTAEVRLGRALLGQQRFQEAEPHTLAGYEILRKQPDPQASFAKGARHDLAVIYTALHEPEKAKEFQTELAVAAIPSTNGK